MTTVFLRLRQGFYGICGMLAISTTGAAVASQLPSTVLVLGYSLAINAGLAGLVVEIAEKRKAVE